MLADLEIQAKEQGLQFIEELVFENGAVYRGKFFPISDFSVFERHQKWNKLSSNQIVRVLALVKSL